MEAEIRGWEELTVGGDTVNWGGWGKVTGEINV